MNSDYTPGATREDIAIIKRKESLPTGTAKEFLMNTPVSTLFPENRTKILVVEKNDTVATAFKILSQNRILSLPVYDPKHGQYIGLIDMLDIVCHCVKDFTDTEMKSDQDFEKLLEAHNSLTKYTCGQVAGASGRNPYYPVEETASLLVSIDLMLAHRANRLPIVDSTGQLTTLISLSTILVAINKRISKFSVKDKTVGELNLGIKDVLRVKGSQRALDAFTLMYEKKVLGVAVTDDNGNLIGNISASDLKQIGESHILARLLVPAEKFIELIPKSADQLPGPYCVRPAATVEEVIEKCVITRSHRIYVVGDNNQPIGVISLIDLLEAIRKNL